MSGSIGGAASATKLGATLALELRTYANPLWNNLSDEDIYDTGGAYLEPWLSYFLEDLGRHLTSQLESTKAVLANTAPLQILLSSLPDCDPPQSMTIANPQFLGSNTRYVIYRCLAGQLARVKRKITPL